uniref:Protein lifeguard 2 n=1 Tax=Geospiza parvula TaxID=87175 RepID=A0A8U8C0X5_GEOPR
MMDLTPCSHKANLLSHGWGDLGGSCSFGLPAGTSPSYGSGGYPGDTELLTTFSWDDRNVRRVFIRKVYAILMVQLLVTVVIVAFFTFWWVEPVKGYIQTHSAWYWAS